MLNASRPALDFCVRIVCPAKIEFEKIADIFVLNFGGNDDGTGIFSLSWHKGNLLSASLER